MLGFRSETHVEVWCEEQGRERRPTISLAQQWRLAVEWYRNRLTVDSMRPDPERMRTIFAELELVEPFWDPQSVAFR